MIIYIYILCILSTVLWISLIIAKLIRKSIKKNYSVGIDGLLIAGSLLLTIMWHNSQLIIVLIFFWALFSLALTDIFYRVLSNATNLGLLLLGLTLSIFKLQPINFFEALMGSITGYLTLWTFAKAYQKVAHRSGIGEGDLKLTSALGAWIGIYNIPYLLFWSSFTGTVFYFIGALFNCFSKNYPIPFGLFLSLAGMGIYIYQFSGLIC